MLDYGAIINCLLVEYNFYIQQLFYTFQFLNVLKKRFVPRSWKSLSEAQHYDREREVPVWLRDFLL